MGRSRPPASRPNARVVRGVGSGQLLPARGIARGWWLLGMGAIGACAATIPPPGGPPRREPPIILSFTPDTNSVNVHPKAVVFQFDEVVSERPQGVAELDRLFLVSPQAGSPDVSWHRDHISIRPPRGFRANTVYTISMLPGLTDLHNNVRKTGAALTFSTGPTIPATIVRGRVFDWVAGTVAPRAFVQAILRSDTGVVYVTVADSTGVFALQHLPQAAYNIRGFVDANNNRALDRTEIWDSAGITLSDTARVELLAFLHDTIGPRITEVSVADSVTLRTTFDRGIDPSQSITADLFSVTAKDSAAVPISAARPAAAYDSAVAAVGRARADSGLRADSIRRADSAGRAPRDTAAARERRERLAARRDSLRRGNAPKPSRPSPVKEVVIQVGAPLSQGAYYRLQARGIRGLLGATRTSDRVFSVPKSSADSAAARARSDSTRRRGILPPVRGTPPPTAPPPP